MRGRGNDEHQSTDLIVASISISLSSVVCAEIGIISHWLGTRHVATLQASIGHGNLHVRHYWRVFLIYRLYEPNWRRLLARPTAAR